MSKKQAHPELPIKLKLNQNRHTFTDSKPSLTSKLYKIVRAKYDKNITNLDTSTHHSTAHSTTKRNSIFLVSSNIEKYNSRKIKHLNQVKSCSNSPTPITIDPNQLRIFLSSFYIPKLYSVLDLLFSASFLSTAYKIESEMANHYKPTDYFPQPLYSTDILPSSLYSTLDFNPYSLTSFELIKIPYLIFESTLTNLNIPYNPKLLNQLIHVIYQGYLANHYHNFYHAIDVLQSTYLFLKHLGLGGDKAPLLHLFTPKLIIGLLIAALSHDIGHPGVSNQFLVKSSFPIASLHPPTLTAPPILEEFHTRLLAYLISTTRLNLAFPTLFATPDELNDLVCPLILATDIGDHFSYLSHLSKLTSFPLNQSHGMTLACGLIKCADLINAARPLPISKIWTLKLDHELTHQSHLQSLLSPTSPTAPSPPSTKLTTVLVADKENFVEAYVVPLFDLVTKLLPWLSPVRRQLEENLESWRNWQPED